MWNIAIALLLVAPQLNCQIYYDDEKTGGFIAMGNAEIPIAQSAPTIPANLSDLRGTETYEQKVDKIIADGILKLTLAVNKAIANTSTEEHDNIVYAPVSIAGSLALILLGSNGKTFAEIAEIMDLATGVNIEDKSQLVHEQFGRIISKLQATSGFDFKREVKFAAGIFLQEGYPIRRLYKETAELIYQAEVLSMDFAGNPTQAKDRINAWFSQRTDGKIPQMLAENPSSASKVILASAMYFKAEWEKPFFDGTTKKRPFYTNGRKVKSDVMVEMMSNGGVFPYFKDRTLNCEILGFPYKGNHTTMYVVVPFDSNKEKLKQLETQLTPAEINRLINNVKYTGAIILFPKMHIDSTIDLRRSLQALGVKSLFNPSQANLALISPGIQSTSQHQQAAASSALNNKYQPSDNKNSNNDIFIFSRNRQENCTQIFDPNSGRNFCQEQTDSNNTITYKKFGDKVGRRISSRIASNLTESLDNIRQSINQHPNPDRYENPGLYADNVLHKIYMDITESGTEAAAATSVSLSRDGGRVTFRVDVPFFFFIMHEQTKTLLFWGSVNTPTPSFN